MMRNIAVHAPHKWHLQNMTTYSKPSDRNRTFISEDCEQVQENILWMKILLNSLSLHIKECHAGHVGHAGHRGHAGHYIRTALILEPTRQNSKLCDVLRIMREQIKLLRISEVHVG